jgi:predicted nucleotidyltransferase component of viral defense system
MTDASGAVGMLRADPDAFDALRDATAERLAVDPGAVEKDYWATEVLRSAARPREGVDQVVFKGGTSLSKAHGIIQRFSEDIDLLVVTSLTGQPLKRLLRMIANGASAHLDVEHEREREGRGFLNARYRYPVRREVPFLTTGVLLEIGSRGGPAPNEHMPVRSLMSHAADQIDPTAHDDYADLAAFEVTVLAAERTLAEKLAFLHHRATVGDLDALTRGARHLYDVAMLLGNDRVRDALADGRIGELMIDIDARSHAAGWDFTPRPGTGFAASPAFTDDSKIAAALRVGYTALEDLVWGLLPSYDEAIDTIRSNRHLV